jgi:hypothetical protein
MTNQIWQVQDGAADGTQSIAGDINTIKFSLSNIDADSNMFGVDITMRNSSPENTNIEGNANQIEDMGIDGIDIKINGNFRNKETDIDKLVDWYLEDKTATSFEEGRFGLQLDFPTRFNIIPVSTFGYQIINPTLGIIYEEKKIAGFTITLRLGGAIKTALTKP